MEIIVYETKKVIVDRKALGPLEFTFWHISSVIARLSDSDQTSSHCDSSVSLRGIYNRLLTFQTIQDIDQSFIKWSQIQTAINCHFILEMYKLTQPASLGK